MTTNSPAVHASRPGALIDPHRQAEYPILLGKSLQGDSATKTEFISLRYNWKPNHLSSKQKTILKATDNGGGDHQYQLTIREIDSNNKPFKYHGYLQKNAALEGANASSSTEQATDLALVFDRQKSAFILETITAALDFNLTSGPGQSYAEIQAHPQLHSDTNSDASGNTNHKLSTTNHADDQAPDNNNPYDFRHFLDEAKAAAEKNLGNRTPIPGGMSGMASPVPGASRYRSGSGPGTPLARPQLASAPLKKKRAAEEQQARDTSSKPRPSTTTHKKQPATKPKSSATSSKSKHVSKVRISDSDEDEGENDGIGDTITLSKANRSKPITTSTPTTSSKDKAKDLQRQTQYAHSPRIEVDEAADLVIDMGSPPRKYQPGRRPRPDFPSPFTRARPSQPRDTSAESDRDAEGEDDDENGDTLMRDAPASLSEDADVEDLILGSPRAAATAIAGTGAEGSAVSRVDDNGDIDDDEDEDDELAAELEAALENEDDEDDEDGEGVGVGLGISTRPAAVEEEESEVSEEE